MKTAEEYLNKYGSSIMPFGRSRIAIEEVGLRKILTEHDAELEKIIPETFFAGLSFEERLKMLVSHWQRAIKVNQELEERFKREY